MTLFAGATEWLDSEPLGPAELEGHVELVRKATEERAIDSPRDRSLTRPPGVTQIPVARPPAPGGSGCRAC